jgi:predicted  nucleic acid-binding Zn-ribbon protein
MNAAGLLALQQIDSALDAVSNRRPRLPEVAAHAAATTALGEVHQRRAGLEGRMAELNAAIDAAEASGSTLASKKARLETQLKTVISPREAEALMSEIATIDNARAELDDQELGFIDEQESIGRDLSAVGADEPGLQGALDEARAALAAANAVLDQEAGELAEARGVAASMLTDSELIAYEQARRHYAGVAVAKLEGRRCSGCHLDLSPAELDVVKAVPAGEPAECPQCSRYLVR